MTYEACDLMTRHAVTKYRLRDEAKDHLSRRRLDRRGVCARNILEEDFPHFFYTLDYGITISYETLMKELPLF